ncbi:aldose 1-epimerase family protein [Rothia sp. LK2588]|uniref:aldose 1-epimerase family protein n=1 Tax=Rothia sp. LK2588 TaxID=3114369 RepID=UPI0034CEEDBB
MSTVIPLHRSLFTAAETTVLMSGDYTVTARTYDSGVESLTVRNSRGYVEVLPFMGQIIWDAAFDGISLRMDNMFRQPKPVSAIQDTYGCFAFHSGLLAAGCPAPEDDHPLHGEFPCAPMDSAELALHEDGALTVRSSHEYVMGFGHHYLATPSVTLAPGSGLFTIGLRVKNLSAYAPMPLQYMCHMNYAFVPEGRMSDNLAPGSFALRRTVPAHVHPTPEWERINERILSGEYDADSLAGAEAFDPEIVYFADDLPRQTSRAEFALTRPDGTTFVTRFDTAQFPVATRWILHNPDQKVAAFVLPGTSRPEGFLAAEKAGTLIHLNAGEERTFEVETGLLRATEAASSTTQPAQSKE